MLSFLTALRGNCERKLAPVHEFVKVDKFLDGVNLMLTGTHGDRGHSMLNQPVGIQTTIGGFCDWRHTNEFRSVNSSHDDRAVIFQMKRRIRFVDRKLECRSLTIDRHNFIHCLFKRRLKSRGDPGIKFRVMTSCFAF